jgi:hypothetical protein
MTIAWSVTFGQQTVQITTSARHAGLPHGRPRGGRAGEQELSIPRPKLKSMGKA